MLTSTSYYQQAPRFMSFTKKQIAILGLGAAGTTLFVNLINQITQVGIYSDLEITLIDKSGEFGPGLAYSTQLDSNLLNTPAFDLGIIHGDKTHFWNWVINNEASWKPYFPYLTCYDKDTPLPRRLYGFYLKMMLRHAKKQAAKMDITVNSVQDEVIDVVKKGATYCLRFQSIAPQTFNFLCCCPGLGKTTRYPQLSDLPNYLTFPGKTENDLLKIPKKARVAILGTRLSAVDCILLLANNGHQGPILSISRTAMMPNVVHKHIKHPRQHLTRENLLSLTDNGTKSLTLKQFASLVRQEYQTQEGKPLKFRAIIKAHTKPITKFRYDIIHTTNKIRPWQAAFYATNDIVNLTWRLLSPEAKQTLAQSYLRLFQSQRIAMPLTNAKQLYRLYQDKKLAFHDKIDQVQYRNNLFYITRSNNDSPIQVDYMIDAAGLAGSAACSPNEFIQNLTHDGLAQIDNFGFIQVCPDTMQVINKHSAKEAIYLLGGLTQGTYIAANLMESIVELSQVIVQDLLTSITM